MNNTLISLYRCYDGFVTLAAPAEVRVPDRSPDIPRDWPLKVVVRNNAADDRTGTCDWSHKSRVVTHTPCDCNSPSDEMGAREPDNLFELTDLCSEHFVSGIIRKPSWEERGAAWRYAHESQCAEIRNRLQSPIEVIHF